MGPRAPLHSFVTGPPRNFDGPMWIGESIADPGGLVSRPGPDPSQWYQFGDAFLGIGGDDHRFLARFWDVYRECGTDPPAGSPERRHLCWVLRRGSDRVYLRFHDPVHDGGPSPDPFGYLDPMLRDWQYIQESGPPAGWRVYRSAHSRACVAFSRDEMVLERRGQWAWIAANAAVSRVLATQPETLYFHGAAMGIAGHGVLMLGPSGAGKTTVALALAARGHSFFSDEIAAIRVTSKELIPVRRSSFVRPGPAAASVEQALARSVGHHPDRQAVSVGELFPRAAAGAVTARYLVLLRRFAPVTRLERFVPGHTHLPTLGPLASSVVAGRPAGRVLQMLSLVNQLECYFLDSASPDGAADAIERLVEG